MIHGVLSSLELHLRFPAGTVVETLCLEDTACGLYPCYYRVFRERLKVCTSAANLIVDAGSLETNPAFQPREYLLRADVRELFVRGTAAFPRFAKNAAKSLLPAPLLRRLSKNRFWYESWDTFDTRVRKLKPFECVAAQGANNGFQPDFSLKSADMLVEMVADHLQRFVHHVETAFPDHEHVLMLAGRDSQIVALIPKQRPERWHVFTAAPNRLLVWKWLAWNNVTTGMVFGHDNHNEETPEETARKIVCSDLYSDPRHMRWLPALKRIADGFGGRCIFWAGSAGDALHVGRSFHRRYAHGNPANFFHIHLTRVPCLVGNYHQVVKNFTGCPLLSPYHSAEIWRAVYIHHGPSVIPAGVDLRPRIGERVAGRQIRWLDENPAPRPYPYFAPFNASEIYLQHLHEAMKNSAA